MICFQYANLVIKEGIFVPELNGYVKIPISLGSAKAPFVGIDCVTKAITTIHLKSVSVLETETSTLGWFAKPRSELTDLVGSNKELGWRSPYRKNL